MDSIRITCCENAYWRIWKYFLVCFTEQVAAERVLCFSKGVLPRELVSDGVLEYKISSSTIWNRCPWAGTDSSHDDSAGLDHTLSHFHQAYVMISAGNVNQFSAQRALQWREEKGCWRSMWLPSLTKADRFLLVFRVSIMSSTIWNRLQCGGTINKLSLQQLRVELPSKYQ